MLTMALVLRSITAGVYLRPHQRVLNLPIHTTKGISIGQDKFKSRNTTLFEQSLVIFRTSGVRLMHEAFGFSRRIEYCFCFMFIASYLPLNVLAQDI